MTARKYKPIRTASPQEEVTRASFAPASAPNHDPGAGWGWGGLSLPSQSLLTTCLCDPPWDAVRGEFEAWVKPLIGSLFDSRLNLKADSSAMYLQPEMNYLYAAFKAGRRGQCKTR